MATRYELGRKFEVHGFPSTEEEGDLRASFLRKFYPIANKYLRDKELSPIYYEQPPHNFVAFLYGIYFYNLLARGRILNPNLSGIYRNRLKQLGLITPSLYRLESWPVILTTDRSVKLAETSVVSRLIKASLPGMFLDNRHTLARFDYSSPGRESTEHAMTYQMRPDLAWTVFGLEEANHADLISLEVKHYRVNPLCLDNRPYSPLWSVRPAQEEDSLIEYYSIDGIEYAAHIVVSLYVKHYHPEVWASGFCAYHEAVTANRKDLFNSLC